MSYVINRDLNFKVIKKNVNITNTINPNSLKESLGSTSSTEFLNANSLSINNIPVTASTEQLNYLQVTPGYGFSLKAIVLDSNRNITNINTLSCNTIIINGNVITSNSDLYGTVSNDINNSYLSNIVNGIGQASKSIILDSTLSINNINKLSTNFLIYKNTYINCYKNKKIFLDDLNSITTTYPFTFNKYITATSTNNGSLNQYLANLTIMDITWSPDLELFVCVCRSPNNYDYGKIYTSTNGYQWQTISHPYQNNHCTSVIWSSNYKIFITTLESISGILVSTDGYIWTTIYLGQSFSYIYEVNNYLVLLGNTNQIAISQDGYNWNYVNFTLNSNVLSGICWASGLNLYVLTASSGSNSNKIYISHDLINWIDVKMNAITNTSQGFQFIAWSEELNILVASGTNVQYYSKDAINWFVCTPLDSNSTTFTDLKWNSELQGFIALNGSNTHIFISYNGISWQRYGIVNNAYNRLIWCNKYGMFSFIRSNGIGNLILNKKKGNSDTYNLFKINNNTNAVGLNTDNPLSGLDINSLDGKCLKFIEANAYNYELNTNSSACDFNIDNGQLNINSYKYNSINPYGIVYVSTNYLTYGLKLNNILIKTTSNEFNYIKNITPGIATANKTLLLDINSNINNINTLSCNSLVINNSEVTSGSFNSNTYLQNSIIGIATAEKALITDSALNITNLNLINANICQFSNYHRLYTNKFNNTNININQMQYNNIKKITTTNLFNSAKWISKTLYSGSIYDVCWCPELNIFVACGYQLIIYSKDGINWNNTILAQPSWTYISITWSPELSLFVVVASNATSNNIVTSKDGINWTYQFNPYTDMAFAYIIWVKELNAFFSAANSGSTSRGLVSYDGEFWVSNNIHTSYSWRKIVWASHLNTFIAINDTNNLIGKSTNGFNWTYLSVDSGTNTFSSYYYLSYSKELGIIIIGTGWQNMYSYDGINWQYTYNGDYLSTNKMGITWHSGLNMFISQYYDRIAYSTDGINFSRLVALTGTQQATWMCSAWSPSLNILIIMGTDNYKLLYSDLINTSYSKSTLYSHKSQMFFNTTNGNLGLGTITPNYQLELSTDNAKKPSTNTWTISSDSRLKENIIEADLNICYNILANLKLKKYKWKESINNYINIKDKHKLGWIADEVENYFPKSILIKSNNNLENCKNLDIDQIVAIMYGTTQKIIDNYNNLDNNIININTKLNNINNFINKLGL